MTALTWIESIHVRCRMYRFSQEILRGNLSLDNESCAALGCWRNIADLQIRDALCGAVDFDAIPAELKDIHNVTSEMKHFPYEHSRLASKVLSASVLQIPRPPTIFKSAIGAYDSFSIPSGYSSTPYYQYSRDITGHMDIDRRTKYVLIGYS